MVALDARTAGQKLRLEKLNRWRNAIAHQNFAPAADLDLGGGRVDQARRPGRPVRLRGALRLSPRRGRTPGPRRAAAPFIGLGHGRYSAQSSGGRDVSEASSSNRGSPPVS